MTIILRTFVARPYGSEALTLNRSKVAWAREHLSSGAPQVGRVVDSFAHVALVGKHAAGWGIAPWPAGLAGLAAEVCLKAWPAQRGGVRACEQKRGLASVNGFIERHGSSRFADWDNQGERVVNFASFRRRDGQDRMDDLFHSQGFQDASEGVQSQGDGQALRGSGGIDLRSAPLEQFPNFPGGIYSQFVNSEYTLGMSLKPQDLLVVLKLWVGRGRTWNYQALAHELGLSAAETHNAVQRARTAGLLPAGELSTPPSPIPIREFLIHGAKYTFPAKLGQVTRGFPTAHAAAPLKDELQADTELPPVWPHKDGTVRGTSVEPLYKSATEAARSDPALYELLALFDALRMGRARERQMAAHFIEERLR